MPKSRKRLAQTASDGTLFWRGERVMRLGQLAAFGPLLPRWVTSRWLLEQALHELGQDATTPHDWALRQRQLYELGALARFLQRAPADLVTRADRIHDWARTPMGGYRHVERRPAVTTWEDLATGERIETANIGSAAMLFVGECAIGRLVPIDGGRMFETVPLRIPEPVARAVAADPAGWLRVLGAALSAGEIVQISGCRFGFLTDVPPVVSAITAYGDLELTGRYPERAARLLESVRRAFTEEPTRDPDVVDVWACLGAELLNPDLLSALADSLRPDGAALCRRLADTLGEPAATLARLVASEAREVA